MMGWEDPELLDAVFAGGDGAQDFAVFLGD